MNILILYYSKSGNTKKLAEVISEGVKSVKDVDYLIKSTKEVKKGDFLNADAIIAGSPVYFGSMAAELKSVFDKFVIIRRQMEGKIGAAFATSADKSGGKETTIISIIQCFLIYGMIIIGDPLDASGHYGVSCVGIPDDNTIENAKKLGKRVALLVKKLRT
jgi:NAD(P)H dehydrogenase (quinone)